MFNTRLEQLTDYPFQRLRELLADIPAGRDPMMLQLGEPQHPFPAQLTDGLMRNPAGFNKYPPADGTPGLRDAIAGWLNRRYDLQGDNEVSADRHVMPLNGTREGLFMLAQLVVPVSEQPGDNRKPLVMAPNPFYQCYRGAAVMAGAEMKLLSADADNGFMPDLDAVSPAEWDRTALFYLCSPANPQGAVAPPAYLQKALQLARKHDFVLACDECYAEIYNDIAPVGGLAVAAAMGEGFDRLVVFHSLSKRSSAPGLRSGFVAGDAAIIDRYRKLRGYGGAPLPLPICDASEALWRDEEHAANNRHLYRQKFQMAERILGHLPGYQTPEGGFFLWLNVGDGETICRRLWAEQGVRVLPGKYLARPDDNGVNPGDPYIRVALVGELDQTEDALTRMAGLLTDVGTAKETAS